MHVMPTSLKFWDKLGLGPKSGKKNVTVFVIQHEGPNGAERDQDHDFEKAGMWRDGQIELWLKNMSELYKACLSFLFFNRRLMTDVLSNRLEILVK